MLCRVLDKEEDTATNGSLTTEVDSFSSFAQKNTRWKSES